MGNPTEPRDLFDSGAPGVLTLRPLGVYDAETTRSPSPKAGQYRLQVGETASVWAVASSPVRGK